MPSKLGEDPFENGTEQDREKCLDLFFKPCDELVSSSPEIYELKQFTSKLSKSESFDWIRAYVDYLWKNVPDLGALLIINNKGELLEHKTSCEFRKEFGLVWNLRQLGLPKIQNKMLVNNPRIIFKQTFSGPRGS